jgi:PTS system galactitol-specific IIB component
MENGKLLVLVVCDAGMAISSMMVNKIEALLSPLKMEFLVVSLLPISVPAFTRQSAVDIIVSTSPIPGDINVPVVNGLPLLTGFRESTFNEEICQLAEDIFDKKTGE